MADKQLKVFDDLFNDFLILPESYKMSQRGRYTSLLGKIIGDKQYYFVADKDNDSDNIY